MLKKYKCMYIIHIVHILQDSFNEACPLSILVLTGPLVLFDFSLDNASRDNDFLFWCGLYGMPSFTSLFREAKNKISP